MHKLRYDFNYINIPNSIYHFTYDKWTNILIEENQILLERKPHNKIKKFNLIQLEKKYLKTIFENNVQNFSFFNLKNNTNRDIKYINNDNNILNKIKLNKKLQQLNNKIFNLKSNYKKINILNIFNNNLTINKKNIFLKENIFNISKNNHIINIYSNNYILNRIRPIIITNNNSFVLNKNIINKESLIIKNNKISLSKKDIKDILIKKNKLLKYNIKNIEINKDIILKNNLKNIILSNNKLLKNNSKNIFIDHIELNNIIRKDYFSNEYNNNLINYYNKTNKNFNEFSKINFMNYSISKKININKESNILFTKNIHIDLKNKSLDDRLINKVFNKDILSNSNIQNSLIKQNSSPINIFNEKILSYNFNKPININKNFDIFYLFNGNNNIKTVKNNIFSGKISNRNIFGEKSNVNLNKNYNKNININNLKSFTQKSNNFKKLDINNLEEFIQKDNNYKKVYINKNLKFIEKIPKKNIHIDLKNKNLNNINKKINYYLYCNFKLENNKDILNRNININDLKYNLKKENFIHIKLNKENLLENSYKHKGIYFKENKENIYLLSNLINRYLYINNQKILTDIYSNLKNKKITISDCKLLDGNLNRFKNIKINKDIKLDKLSSKSYYIKSNDNFLLYNELKDDKDIKINKDIKLDNDRNKDINNHIYINNEVKLETNRNKYINNNIFINKNIKLYNDRNKDINNHIYINNEVKLNKDISSKINTKNNISMKNDIKNIIGNNHIKQISREHTKNMKIELNKESFGELYKSLWFIKGIGETDLKILPNTDFNYPAMIDIFVEKPNFTYLFEYESKFDIYFDNEYIIELYDYDYNMISMLKIPQVEELETQNEIIKLKIEKVILNQLNGNEKHFKFKIEIKYPELSYIIIRQPIDNYVNSVLYTVTRKFLGENRHPIPFGSDLGIKEIPVHINIMVEFINILILIWQHRFLAFSGQTGIQAIYGLVNLVYEWLNLDPSKNAKYIDEYYRCFRWLRWESEKVYNIAKADPKLNGNKWINFVINEMIDYMEMHHIDIMPILEDIRNTDDWRNIFGNPTFDIKVILDKFKGERKRLSDNNYRMTSARTI